MKANTRKFEREYIKVRDRIEKKGVNMAQVAIIAQYKQFLNDAKSLKPSEWDKIEIKSDPIKKFFEAFYPMSAPLGLMTKKYLSEQKASDDNIFLSLYQMFMQKLVSTKVYSDRIKSITNTTSDRINTVLRDLMTTAELEGWPIDKIRRGLIERIGDSITGNIRARAQGIAQTEMISASNQASSYAAESTGLEYRKYWSTSHLKDVRLSHIQAEQESISREGLKPNETFSNGLLYPGDPNGDAEDVINCRCTILHDLV
jgi:hypothetical protein